MHFSVVNYVQISKRLQRVINRVSYGLLEVTLQ